MEKNNMDVVIALTVIGIVSLITACAVYWMRENTDAAKALGIVNDNKTIILGVEKRITEREFFENQRHEALQLQVTELKLVKSLPVLPTQVHVSLDKMQPIQVFTNNPVVQHLPADTITMNAHSVSSSYTKGSQAPLIPTGNHSGVKLGPKQKSLLEKAGIKYPPKENN